MDLLLDIGNTHTHVGLFRDGTIADRAELPTKAWFNGTMLFLLRGFCGENKVMRTAFCSVVPTAAEIARDLLNKHWGVQPFELTCDNLYGIGIDYPAPETIGTDRLANAIALAHYYGSPSIAVDFGTAVTFDIIDEKANYIGGIITPGLAAMTSYLHEKTAQLPCIEIREVNSVIGKNTTEAMRIGAVLGYRGLIKELLFQIKQELHYETIPVVATGGYAELISQKIPDIANVDPILSLKGILLALNNRG